MKMFRKEEGFTLVELMVVVLIIGILIAVAIPVFNTASANAESKTCAANRRTMDGAIQQYVAADPGNAEADIVAPAGLVPAYIRVAPVCPTGGVYSIAAGASDCTLH